MHHTQPHSSSQCEPLFHTCVGIVHGCRLGTISATSEVRSAFLFRDPAVLLSMSNQVVQDSSIRIICHFFDPGRSTANVNFRPKSRCLFVLFGKHMAEL